MTTPPCFFGRWISKAFGPLTMDFSTMSQAPVRKTMWPSDAPMSLSGAWELPAAGATWPYLARGEERVIFTLLILELLNELKKSLEALAENKW